MSKKLQITKEILIKEYWDNKKSQLEISKILGISPISVYRYFKLFNIKTRNTQEQQKIVNRITKYNRIITKELLIEEYQNRRKSIIEIAKQFKCDRKNISFYLKKYNIKTRPHSEWLKGIPRSKEFKELCRKIRLEYYRTHPNFQKGKNNSRYIDGRNEEEYPLEFNDILKENIRFRDKYICQNCGKSQESELKKYGKRLSIHHIDYNKHNCNKTNLITVCNSCNNKANSKRNKWQNLFNNKIKEIYATC